MAEVKECCVTGCELKPRNFISNNLFGWSEAIPFCDYHFDLYKKHQDAREKMFREQGSHNTCCTNSEVKNE